MVSLLCVTLVILPEINKLISSIGYPLDLIIRQTEYYNNEGKKVVHVLMCGVDALQSVPVFQAQQCLILYKITYKVFSYYQSKHCLNKILG